MNLPKLLRRSRVLHAMREGRSATCFKTNLADPRVVEIAAMSGVDAVWMCNEHVPSDWSTIENQIRAAKLYDVDTFVRVERGSYSDYNKPLEADATGIIVPHVSSAEEVEQIVNWTRCFPVGRRPMDGGNADGKFSNLPLADYIENNLAERFIIIQIESPEGLKNLPEMLTVPGYDFVCFGPGDYCHRMGKAGRVKDADVIEARRSVARLARAHGKYVMAASMLDTRSVLEEEGHSFFQIGADVIGLSEYVRSAVKSFHSPALVRAE